MPGVIAHHGQIQFGQRIGSDDLQNLARFHGLQHLPRTHHRHRAHRPTDIEPLVG